MVWVPTIAQATQKIEEEKFDLVLLDVMLPDGDGYQFCSLMQANDKTRNIPVIFLTSKGAAPDKVLGFSVGADDYVVKPIEPLEFRARVAAKLKKRERDQRDAEFLNLGDVQINSAAQRAFVVENGRKRDLNLTPIEFRLLTCLARNEEQLFSREQLLDTLWGTDVHVFPRSIDTHISKLRKKLGSKAYRIQSVHGTGYRFSMEPNESESRAKSIS